MIGLNKIDTTQLVIVGAAAFAAYFIGKKVIEESLEVAADAAQAVNPVNPDNIFASGVDALGASLSGDDDFSLGSFIFDVLHSEPDL